MSFPSNQLLIDSHHIWEHIECQNRYQDILGLVESWATNLVSCSYPDDYKMNEIHCNCMIQSNVRQASTSTLYTLKRIHPQKSWFVSFDNNLVSTGCFYRPKMPKWHDITHIIKDVMFTLGANFWWTHKHSLEKAKLWRLRRNQGTCRISSWISQTLVPDP